MPKVDDSRGSRNWWHFGAHIDSETTIMGPRSRIRWHHANGSQIRARSCGFQYRMIVSVETRREHARTLSWVSIQLKYTSIIDMVWFNKRCLTNIVQFGFSCKRKKNRWLMRIRSPRSHNNTAVCTHELNYNSQNKVDKFYPLASLWLFSSLFWSTYTVIQKDNTLHIWWFTCAQDPNKSARQDKRI